LSLWIPFGPLDPWSPFGPWGQLNPSHPYSLLHLADPVDPFDPSGPWNPFDLWGRLNLLDPQDVNWESWGAEEVEKAHRMGRVAWVDKVDEVWGVDNTG